MKNTLSDLNNYLFEAIESVNKIAKTIIDNGNLALQAKKHFDEYGSGEDVEIPLLGITNK